MSVPYTKIDSISKPDATAVVLDLDFPSRCLLTRLVVSREGGAGEVTVDVFDQDPDDFATDNPEALHRVLATQTTSSGVIEYRHDGDGVPYINQDAPTDLGYNRKVYIRLSGVGTGTFHVAMGGVTPNM